MSTKPRLLLFQQQYNQRAVSFMTAQQQQHVQCLSHFFDVVVVNEDCDYRRVCDKYQPGLAVFESGVNLPGSRRIEISNVRTCEDIPKLGFHNADSWCETLFGFLSDMEHRGIEQYFSICTTMAEHVPEIASQLFSWPNSIDPNTYKDYGETKFIPFFLSGVADAMYPWRASVFATLSAVYPSLVCPHPGYLSRTRARQAMWGETYARAINASWFAPTCGTIAKEIIRKHFEFPACKACLITEESAGLRAAGFIDMQNCVFANERNVLDKVAYLFENQDQLLKIIIAGYELVHSRHTLYHRDQIFQWYTLNKTLGPDEKIVQLGPFETLTVVARSSGINNVHISSMGWVLSMLRLANELLVDGKYDEAERTYLRCATIMTQLAEPMLGITLCNLYRGDAKVALSWIIRPIRNTLAGYKAADPDPIEWAYLIISMLSLGKLKSARRRAAQFPWLRHPELDRTRWITELLFKGDPTHTYVDENNTKPRRSIHRLPNRDLGDWLRNVRQILKACGQEEAAKIISRAIVNQSASGQTSFSNVDRGSGNVPPHRLKKLVHGLLWRKANLRGLDNPLLVTKAVARLAELLLRMRRQLDMALGRISVSRSSNDERQRFLQRMAEVLHAKNIKSVLLLGINRDSAVIEMLKEAYKDHVMRPNIYCIDLDQGKSVIKKEPGVRRYILITILSDGVEKLIDVIKAENQLSAFDVIVVDSADNPTTLRVSPRLRSELRSSQFVALANVGSSLGHELYVELLRNRTHGVVALGDSVHNGFAIFGRQQDALIAMGT